MQAKKELAIVQEVKAAEKSAQKISKTIGAKTCFVCEENKAEYHIKGEPDDAYCKECAQDAFGDVDCLVKF